MKNSIEEMGMPELCSPVDGMTLLDAAVQFCWTRTEDGFGYNLQYARRQDFADATSLVMQNLPERDRYAHLPDPVPSSGRWFWRVRTMNGEGCFGGWTPARSFTVVATPKQKERELEISRAHPLFLFHISEIAESWRTLPDNLKPYSALRVESFSPEGTVELCEEAERRHVPILIQLSGPHDSYGGKYARILLSDVEYIFQRYSMVKGVQIVEQSCQGGLAQPRVRDYLIRLMRLAAAYGKVMVWADGHWHGNNIWIDAALDEELYRTMAECGDHVIPMWKMNCGWLPYSVQGAVSGMWMGGAVANWGAEPESWFWYEAGFDELGVQYGFKQGDISGASCPPTLWGQMILMGLSGGATAICIEPGHDVWDRDTHEITDTGRQVIFPLLSRIVEWRLIPEKEQVLDVCKVGCIARKADSPWSEDGGPLRTIYEGSYGLDHPFKLVPATARYGWIPILSPYASEQARKRFSSLIHSDSFATPEDVRVYFDSIRGQRSEVGPPTSDIEPEPAWTARVGDAIFVTNHHENKDIVQSFRVPLDGAFVEIGGDIEVNGYLIARQDGDGTLRIHLNGRQDRTTRLRVSAEGLPRVEVTPQSAVQAERRDEASGWIEWVIGFAQGAVDVTVGVG